MTTISDLLKRGVALHQLPTDNPTDLVEEVHDPRYAFWYRVINPETGETSEVRGRRYWDKETLINRSEYHDGNVIITNELWSS